MEQVSDLARGREVMATRKDRQEVLNYLDVLENIRKLVKGNSVHEKDILDIHRMITKETFYRALQSVDQKTLDLTSWLEYFAEGVNVSIEEVKKRVIKLSSERLRRAREGQIALTGRQMQIVEHINLNGKITNREVRKMFKLSNRAALDEINKLIELQVLKSKGKGRGLHYILA